MKLVLILLLLAPHAAISDTHTSEIRCCVEIERDKRGDILRNWSVKNEFRKRWPCPTGASQYAACEGWQIDHVIPLACGGIDAVWNMQWLPVEIKTCAGELCKDRFERKIYC